MCGMCFGIILERIRRISEYNNNRDRGCVCVGSYYFRSYNRDYCD